MKFPSYTLGILLIGLGAALASAQTPAAPARMEARRDAAVNRLSVAQPQVRFYRTGDSVTRVYGAPVAGGTSPIQAAEQFRTQFGEALSAEPADMIPTTPILDGGNTLPLMYDGQTGEYKFTMVYYSQQRGGIPVFRADARMLVRNETGNPLVWVGSSLRNLGDFSPPAMPDLSSFNAAAVAPAGMTGFTPPEVVIWAGVEDMVVEPVLAVSFIADNDDDPNAAAPERWRLVVDLSTHEVLYRENLIIFTDVTGTVSGLATEGFKADFCNNEVSTPMPYAKATIGATSVYADINGNFTIPNSGSSAVTVESPMTGRYFYVDNYVGSEETLTQVVTPPGPANFTHNQANVEFLRAQVNGYIQSNVVRDYILRYHPTYPTIYAQLDFPVRVNRTDGYCPGNAWYSGNSINFCQAGGISFPNTAFADVIYHEYGHHVVEMGGSGQDQYGEGMSDCISVLITDQSAMAVGFTGDCNSSLRNADNTFQYPCGGESHYCGNLLSGCMWSLRNELLATNPLLYRDILSALTINSVPMHSGSQITPQITIDFLTLDDNDGNIYNGTPHAEEICTAFGAHSMDCPDGVLNPIDFAFPNGKPSEVSPQQAYAFSANAVSAGGTPVPGTGQLHYSIDGGAWTTVALTQTADNQYQVTLPAIDCRSQLAWYLSAQGTDTYTYNDPVAAPATTYLTTGGRVLSTARYDTFESALGWTVGDTGDGATAGIWEIRDPEATTAQPGDDHTPYPWKKCWVTDGLAGGSPDARDVDGGKTTLMSPTLNLASIGEPTISYWRWYCNDKGAAPNSDTLVVDISNNNGSSWTTVETVGPSGTVTSGGWYRHAFRVADFVTPTSTVKVRFVASDYGPDSTVEAAIDDFQVTSDQCDLVAPAPNPPTWVQVPTPISTTSITMQAYSADASGVEYTFDGTGNNAHDRPYAASPTYTDTGMDINRNYTFRVKARDGALPIPNETAYSDNAQVATFIQTPTGLTVGTVTQTSIQLTAPGTFTRLTAGQSGLYFEVLDPANNPVGGSNANAWVKVQTITATGLSPGTTYRLRIKARNYYSLNETPWYPTSGYISQATQYGACTLTGDMNQDGFINGQDIGGFIRAKLGGQMFSGENPNCANYGGTLEQDTTNFVADLLGL